MGRRNKEVRPKGESAHDGGMLYRSPGLIIVRSGCDKQPSQPGASRRRQRFCDRCNNDSLIESRATSRALNRAHQEAGKARSGVAD
jgi:hypothetical protein